jgi:hypothetical protein
VAFDIEAGEINFPNGHVDYSKVHDQVVAIDPANMTVTANVINGFSFGRPVWYLSMETSTPLGAAIEHNVTCRSFIGLSVISMRPVLSEAFETSTPTNEERPCTAGSRRTMLASCR